MLAGERQESGRVAYDMGLAPRVPVVAGLRHDVGDFHLVDEVVWAFKNRPDEAGRQMPCDVAVEGPDAGVVLVPLKNDIAVGLKLGNVTSRRVGLVGHGAIPAGAKLFKSLASKAVSDDAVVVLAYNVKNLTLISAV